MSKYCISCGEGLEESVLGYFICFNQKCYRLGLMGYSYFENKPSPEKLRFTHLN